MFKSDHGALLTRVTSHGEGRLDHPIVNLQISEMYYQIQTDATDKRWWDYSGLVKTKNARSRLVCVLGMAVRILDPVTLTAVIKA